jgi:3-hydroxyisobutyrate dehydrogenase-like beta-hydroxyacid dehydrogenase
MIGVAGCGRMGAPMLSALRAAGIDARGFDIQSADHFGALGKVITNNPAVFAETLSTLITVVRDIDQTEEVLFDTQGFVHRAPLERIIICSTLSPRYVRALRDRIPKRITLIDAPMSGAQISAQEARLSFMLGGEAADLDAAQPLFDAMGTHFHRMGAFGTGMQAKVLNNLLAASSTAMTRLVLDWAAKSGVDEALLMEAIATSSGQNWFASQFGTIEFSHDGYAPDNSIGALVKDVDSALDAAPPGADTTLPRQVRSAISGLRPKPR